MRQFKSVRRCDVRLNRLALLVGPNGAGKSNVLDALRLTSEALNTSLEHALRDRGGVSEVRRRSTGHPTHFRVELDFAGPTSAGAYSFEIAAVRGGEYRVSREECRVVESALGGQEHRFRVQDGELISSSGDTPLPRVLNDRLFLVAVSGLEEYRSVYDGLSTMQVYNLNPGQMRQLQKPDCGELLHRDGSNSASVLERLRREAPEQKARVEAYLREIVEGVDGVDREGLSSWEGLRFRQRVEGSTHTWDFPATSMSDGTLRALGVLIALFATPPTISGPLGIEEPEAALHPAASAVLMEALRDASERRQVLATSHSPDLLDVPGLQPDELVAVRAVEGTTLIGPPDRASRLALRDQLYGAGELLRTDQLQPDYEQLELGL